MTIDVLLVDAAALLTVAWIAWYFWLSEEEAVAAAVGSGGAQEILIRVKGGYDPDLVVVRAGRPVRLLFNRQETASCSEMVQFPDFGVSRHLPAGETVAVELEAPEAGEYEFACQMGMLRGRLIVTENGRPDRS